MCARNQPHCAAASSRSARSSGQEQPASGRIEIQHQVHGPEQLEEARPHVGTLPIEDGREAPASEQQVGFLVIAVQQLAVQQADVGRRLLETAIAWARDQG
jgi:hypothetical protein